MWIYLMADALVDAGVYAGFSRTGKGDYNKESAGVAMILDETGVTPKSRVDEMCSPAGLPLRGSNRCKKMVSPML